MLRSSAFINHRMVTLSGIHTGSKFFRQFHLDEHQLISYPLDIMDLNQLTVSDRRTPWRNPKYKHIHRIHLSSIMWFFYFFLNTSVLDAKTPKRKPNKSMFCDLIERVNSLLLFFFSFFHFIHPVWVWPMKCKLGDCTK